MKIPTHSPTILLGAPGSGRSALYQPLSQLSGLPVLAARGLLWSASQAKGARVLRMHLEAGTPVPVAVAQSVIGPALAQAPHREGCLLDGYPQSLEQAQALDAWLQEHDLAPSYAIKLELPHDEVLRRLSGRRFCRRCPELQFNIFYAPPQAQNRCDQCGGDLHQRIRDRSDLVLRRLHGRAQLEGPMERYYQEGGRLKRVDARGGLNLVLEQLGGSLTSEAMAVGL